MKSDFSPQLNDTSLMTPYELLCYKNNVFLVDLKKGESLKKMKEYNINWYK